MWFLKWLSNSNIHTLYIYKREISELEIDSFTVTILWVWKIVYWNSKSFSMIWHCFTFIVLCLCWNNVILVIHVFHWYNTLSILILEKLEHCCTLILDIDSFYLFSTLSCFSPISNPFLCSLSFWHHCKFIHSVILLRKRSYMYRICERIAFCNSNLPI